MITIGLDMMGGDFAPLEAVKGTSVFFEANKEGVHLVLIGDEEKIKIFSIDPKGKLKLSGETAKFKKGDEIGVLIGPEGGWTERELELFRLKKIPIYSLGSQILRAETAAIAVSSILLLN